MKNTLLMPFIDESETFTLGFECGQIWQRISEGESFNRCLIHKKNEAQIKMIADSFGVYWKIEKSNDEWSLLTIKSAVTS